MGFPRQEYLCWLPFPFPGDFANSEIESMSPSLAGSFFTTEPPGKPKAYIWDIKWFLEKEMMFKKLHWAKKLKKKKSIATFKWALITKYQPKTKIIYGIDVTQHHETCSREQLTVETLFTILFAFTLYSWTWTWSHFSWDDTVILTSLKFCGRYHPILFIPLYLV